MRISSERLVVLCLLAMLVCAPLTAADVDTPMNGDVNCDGQRNIADAVYVLSWLFGGGPGPCPVSASEDLLQQIRVLENSLDLKERELQNVFSELQVCDLRLELAETKLHELWAHDWISIPMTAVLVANDNGSRPVAINSQQITQWVDRTNEIYETARVSIRFNEATDVVTFRSSLVNGIMGTHQADWAVRRDTANAFAAGYPGRLVVFFRHGPDADAAGGGFSWTDYNFAVMPGFLSTGVCGHQNITLFPHEVGHYLGLSHTFALEFVSIADATTAFSNSGHNTLIFDADGLADTVPDPFIRDVQCDGSEAVNLAGDQLPLERYNIMSYYDSEEKTLSQEQVGILRQVAAIRTGTDVRRLVLPWADYLVEGETLAEKSTGTGNFNAQKNMWSFHGKWTGDAQLWWGGTASGNLRTSFTVPQAGRYRMFASFTYAPDFGIHQIAVNGIPARRIVDLYSSIVRCGALVDLGTFWITGGDNQLAFQSVGKNAQAIGYGLGLDFLLLQRAQ